MTTELVDNEWNAPSRLVYLAEVLHIPIPTKIVRLLPTGKILSSIVTRGIKATAIEMNIKESQLMNLYEEGKNIDDTKASENEFRHLIGKMASDSLSYKDEDMNFSESLAITVEIAEFVNTRRSQLIEFEEASLASKDIDFNKLELPTFQTGFQPLDVLTDGIAQTLVMFMARPGTGKTSHFLSLMGAMRRTNVVSSIWFFSLEMPLAMMQYRAKSLLQTIDFKEDDKFFCGQYTPANILSMIEENPDPNRVIIYDSPDALGGGGDQRRFVLEDIYRDLVKIKTNAKAVFTASQPRRADRVLSLDSVAESWAKAWYTEVMVTITNQGLMRNPDYNRMQMATVKNRFGRSGRIVEYGYNYQDLSYQETSSSMEASGWGSSDELRNASGDAPIADGEGEW